jgi:hypothetical protein
VIAIELRVLDGEYAVWKLPPGAAFPDLAEDDGLQSVTRTAAELSVVARADQAPAGIPVERGWSALEVAGPLAFELTGVLAAIASPLAEAAVPIFVVSTFDTDYVLVRTAHLDRAVGALEAVGHSVTKL